MTLTRDQRVIRDYAAGRADYREDAIAAYRRMLRVNEERDVFMDFMGEVDNPVPDLALRARYRIEVLRR
jgi:hypothetical protein